MKFIIWFCCLIFYVENINAQTLPVARNYQTAYDKKTRSIDGKPGTNYWQNKSVYNINVNFSPASKIIAGSEEINYTNNSTDTLKQIWFKLYPNIYKKGSPRDMPVDANDLTDGVRIENFSIDGVNQNTDALHISGTNMFMRIAGLMPENK